jgi:hypothetical protein
VRFENQKESAEATKGPFDQYRAGSAPFQNMPDGVSRGNIGVKVIVVMSCASFEVGDSLPNRHRLSELRHSADHLTNHEMARIISGS